METILAAYDLDEIEERIRALPPENKKTFKLIKHQVTEILDELQEEMQHLDEDLSFTLGDSKVPTNATEKRANGRSSVSFAEGGRKSDRRILPLGSSSKLEKSVTFSQKTRSSQRGQNVIKAKLSQIILRRSID